MIRRMLNQRTVRRYLDEMMSVCLHSTLTFNALYKKKTAAALLRQWEINDTDSIYRKLKWLLEEGYRSEFEHARRYLSTFSESERRSLAPTLTEGDMRLRKLSIAERYGRQLPSDGIAAFDYAWCILLTSVASDFKWIDPELGLSYAIQAASGAQSAYSSWEEYVLGYSVGAEFSGRFQEADFGSKNEAFLMDLLQTWQSPGNRLDWNTPLRHF